MPNKEKTLIRTVRIPKSLDALLRKDAKTKRITVNALISSIMTKYAEWDRYNERFAVISIKRDAFRSILGMIEDDKIIRVSKEIGTQIPKQFILFWFKKTTLETYLEYMSLVCRYAEFAQYEVDTDGNNYTMTLLHDLDEKWSLFLKNWIEQGMKTTIGIIPLFDVSKNSVIVKFRIS
jgi:hypothetical protein